MNALEDRIYLQEMAEHLERAPHTLRQWIREKEREPSNPRHLPDELVPHREGGRNVIFWTRDQLVPLVQYGIERSRRRGWQPAT